MTLEYRLENWGRVWRTYIRRPSVYSIEGQYRNPWGRHYDYDSSLGRNGVTVGIAPVARQEFDGLDAQTVERAACTLDIYHHVILKGHYVREWSPWKTLGEARRAAGESRVRRRGDYDASLAMARALVSSALDRPATIRRVRVVQAVHKALALPDMRTD